MSWSRELGKDPLLAERVHIELYIRWMQEVRGLKPSTVSRRVSVVVGFYRTCVLDGVLPTSPAEHVRRPTVPTESPTLGLSHLQFEAMLHAAKQSANVNDFALITMLGLLGLWIFEACGADIEDLGEEHGRRVLTVRGKGGKVVLTHSRQRSSGPSNAPPGNAPPGRSREAPAEPAWTATPPLADSGHSRRSVT